jgi:hypothetical protein
VCAWKGSVAAARLLFYLSIEINATTRMVVGGSIGKNVKESAGVYGKDGHGRTNAGLAVTRSALGLASDISALRAGR